MYALKDLCLKPQLLESYDYLSSHLKKKRMILTLMFPKKCLKM